MKLLYSLFLCSIILSNLTNAQCNGRYLDSIFPTISKSTVEFGENIKYNGVNQKLNMDIYEPVGDVVKNRPCVVFCFGGSFIAGDRSSAELVAMSHFLAKKGYICVSIDYRLDESLNLFTEDNMTKAVIRASQDGKAAVRFLHKNANFYGIDSNQIFIGGTSAGGLLAINMAYMTSSDPLSANWIKWSNEVGGLEGNSGTPGYSAKVKGVFSFAGAIGDTNIIGQNDLPIYMCHASGDVTVPIGYGKPLAGIAPVTVYGSDMMNEDMKRKNIYVRYDRYTSTLHPPFNNVADLTVLDSTMQSMKLFLYDNIACNPNKFNAIGDLISDEVSIYPNPTYNHIVSIENYQKAKSISIQSINGQDIKISNNWKESGQIDMLNNAKGMYIMQINLDNSVKTIKFAIQ